MLLAGNHKGGIAAADAHGCGASPDGDESGFVICRREAEAAAASAAPATDHVGGANESFVSRAGAGKSARPNA